jgi:hypothetical protein
MDGGEERRALLASIVRLVAYGTLQDYFLAASERMHDGLALLVEGQLHGGVYLLGYGAEMWLKTGYFKLRGARITDIVTITTAKADAQAHGWASSKTTGHDLDWWLRGIVYQRGVRGLPSLAATWTPTVTTIASKWSVEMRYLAAQRTEADAIDILTRVSWIEKHHADLWS